MPQARWVWLSFALLFVAACPNGAEEARPASTTSSGVPETSTTLNTRPIPTCRVPTVEGPRDTIEIRVFFFCGVGLAEDPLVPVVRRVPKTQAKLQAAMETLVRGPTADEKAAGLRSAVPEEASQAAVRASITNGVASVEIDYDLASVNNFTTTNFTFYFLGGLFANVFQFDTVRTLDLTPLCPSLTELTCEPATRREWLKGTMACPPTLPTGSLCARR